MRLKTPWYKTVFFIFLLILVFMFGVLADKIFLYKYDFNQINLFGNAGKNKNTQDQFIVREKEPDNSFSQAMEIKNGYETQSSLNSGNDADFYFFNVEKPSNVRIAFKDVPYEYRVFIYDSSRLAIASSTRKGFIASAALLSIQNPGKYYIEVQSNKNGSKTTPYSITLNILPILK